MADLQAAAAEGPPTLRSLQPWQAERFRWVGRLFPLTLLFTAVLLAGCVEGLRTEQRRIELPPNVNLSTASQLGQAIIARGFFTDVQKQFPSLTEQQFQGVYLKWTTEKIKGNQRVCLVTGIRYSRSLPEAKAVADYCESLVKAAVVSSFPAPDSK